MNYTEFAALAGITMEWEYIGPWYGDGAFMKEPGRTFTITLKRIQEPAKSDVYGFNERERTMRFAYHMGPGIKDAAPKLEDVLYAIATDAHTAEEYDDVMVFAVDFGFLEKPDYLSYDKDYWTVKKGAMKARSIFDACQEMKENLSDFLMGAPVPNEFVITYHRDMPYAGKWTADTQLYDILLYETEEA